MRLIGATVFFLSSIGALPESLPSWKHSPRQGGRCCRSTLTDREIRLPRHRYARVGCNWTRRAHVGKHTLLNCHVPRAAAAVYLSRLRTGANYVSPFVHKLAAPADNRFVRRQVTC